MKECGLKRGTFYHMIADYKEQKIVNKNDFLLGFKFNYNAINDILDKLL